MWRLVFQDFVVDRDANYCNYFYYYYLFLLNFTVSIWNSRYITIHNICTLETLKKKSTFWLNFTATKSRNHNIIRERAIVTRAFTLKKRMKVRRLFSNWKKGGDAGTFFKLKIGARGGGKDFFLKKRGRDYFMFR